ncbi:MAG: hypothetical protein ACR2FE_00195 [Aeromicrobium sp.]
MIARSASDVNTIGALGVALLLGGMGTVWDARTPRGRHAGVADLSRVSRRATPRP